MSSYRTALISFIDILGFREIIKSIDCDEIKRILGLMRAVSWGDDSGESYAAKVVQFSDSIIRIRPIDSKNNEEWPYGALYHELSDIGIMQGQLANSNIYIRGGLTIGEISYENEQIFGPGFVRAYDLESKIANYPRVVVDRKILDAMKSDRRLYSSHNEINEELSFISRQMSRGNDGIHFIDYLRVTINNIDDPEINGLDFIKKHKEHILKNIKSKTELNGESSKYLWAAIYHNEYLNKEIKNDRESEELWISHDDLPLLESLTEYDV